MPPLSPPVKVISWYNRRERAWVVQSLDREGNQIGEADYCPQRAMMVKCVAMRRSAIPASPSTGERS